MDTCRVIRLVKLPGGVPCAFLFLVYYDVDVDGGVYFLCCFFFNDTATTEIYTNLNTLSLHDALPIYSSHIQKSRMPSSACDWSRLEEHTSDLLSHSEISYAVFCLKKK